MPSELPQFTIRVSPQTLYKIRYIAGENERSANKEIAVLIKRHIASYETEHGVIQVPVKKSPSIQE